MSKFSTDAGFLTIVEVGQYFLTKDTEEFSQFTESVACHKYTLPRDENHLTRKVGSEGTPRLGPYWKLQPVAYKVNMERKSELSFWTKTVLTHGSEFTTAWINWSQTWTTRTKMKTSRKPQKCSSKIVCKWFCKPIKGQSKTTKTRFCQLIHKNFYYWRKNLDWYWTTKIVALRLSNVEETDQSSSSWWSTSRKWWSDWILENKRLS